MFRRALLALACVLAVTLPGYAQEQTGSIQGTVKDSTGAVLPGVTVELVNTGRGTAAGTAVTDANGQYRFVGLLPGKYEAAAKLQGFTPAKMQNIDLRLGQLLTADLTLSVGGQAETVQVTAESPILDTKQSARGTNIRAEQIDRVPHGRDFTTLVTQAPGANQEAKLGGISIDGASASENRFIVDGIETTDLQNGLSGKNLISDFVEEVQVKSSGYTAEFGGATGGVINVQTKSGTNAFHGTGLLYFEGDATSGGQTPAAGVAFSASPSNTGVPTLRTSLTNSDVAEYVTYPEDDWNRVEPGFSLGGPLVRDRLWFFGAYQPAITNYTRTVNPETSQNPDAATISSDRKERVQYATANVTSQMANNLRTRVAFNNSWSKRSGLLPTLNGLDPADTNYRKASEFPNWSLSANADWVASPSVVFGIRGGYYTSDWHDSNVTEEPRIRWTTTSNIGLAGVPVELQRGTNFTSIPTNNKVDRDQQTRAYFQADATWFASFAGQHQFKGGVQFDRVGNNVLSGESRPLVTIRWDTPLSSGRPVTRGPFGYYEVRSNGVDPTKGFITEGNIHTNNIGLFVQDAWTIADRLTLNLGVRTERERVPTYTVGEDIPDFGIKFNFADKLAPRAGFAYDLRGDGRWKLYGSWGVFYDIFKLELPRGSFGGDKWLSYYYTLDTPDWRTIVPNGCPPACSGTLIRGPIDFRHPSFGSDAIDPNLKPMRSQEATFGIDHELSSVMAVSARYVHKQIDRGVEDAGSQDAAGNEIYVIANPGEGLTELAFADPEVKLPKPQRDYDALELAFEKRFSDNWFLRTSYTLSRLYGNYSGLSQGDESGRTSPNVGRLYDFTEIMFDGNINPLLGRLPTDRPHQWKTQFIYAFQFGTTVGLSEYVSSGVPVTREVGIFPTSNYPFMWRGRMSDGRTDVYSQTDFLVSHELKLGGDKRIRLEMNVQNLFNQRAAISKYSTYHKTNGIEFDPADFYNRRLNFDQLIEEQGIEMDPRFLKDDAFQFPILARFGVKFLF
jgi:outer membrane receptor protein involved in Fe transport